MMAKGITNPIQRDEMILALRNSYNISEAGRLVGIKNGRKAHHIITRLGIDNPRQYLKRKRLTYTPVKRYIFRDARAAMEHRVKIQLPANERNDYWNGFVDRWVAAGRERPFQEGLVQGVIS